MQADVASVDASAIPTARSGSDAGEGGDSGWSGGVGKGGAGGGGAGTPGSGSGSGGGDDEAGGNKGKSNRPPFFQVRAQLQASFNRRSPS